MTKIIENIQNPHRPRIPIGEPYPNRSNHLIRYVLPKFTFSLCVYFTSISFPEKHVREYPKTCTTFRKNMYVFRRKHYDVFTTLIFNPLKTRPDFLLIVKFFLFRDTRKRRGINTHTFTHWLKAKKEERELAFLRTYLCR